MEPKQQRLTKSDIEILRRNVDGILDIHPFVMKIQTEELRKIYTLLIRTAKNLKGIDESNCSYIKGYCSSQEKLYKEGLKRYKKLGQVGSIEKDGIEVLQSIITARLEGLRSKHPDIISISNLIKVVKSFFKGLNTIFKKPFTKTPDWTKSSEKKETMERKL